MFSDKGVSTVRKNYYTDLIKRLELIDTYRVPYKSNTEYTPLKVYEIPIGDRFETMLRFNLDNSRIIKHVLAARENGQELNPERKETQDFIRNILLNDKFYSKHAIKNLKEDLEHTGQLDPAIISCDGTIWNGNRRIAAIADMFKTTGDPKYSRVKAVFLPELTKKQLKQLEYRLQLAHDFKEDYDRVTLFLLCRARINEGWSYSELENSFKRRYTKKQIIEFIKQIDIIDKYLERIGRPKEYTTLGDKGVEFFTAVQSHIDYEKNKRGTSAVEIDKITSEFFSAAVHKDSIYQDARNLSMVLKKDTARNIYLKNSQIYNNYPEYTKPDNNKTEKTFYPATVNSVLKNIRSAHAEMKSVEADTPFDLAEKALKRLNEIKAGNIDPVDTAFVDKLDEISDLVKRLKLYADNV